MFRAAVEINRNKSCEYETWPNVLLIIQTKQAFAIDMKYFNTCTLHGPARRRHQHTYCVYSHHTDGLHENCSNKMILDHFIINRRILIF